MRLMSRLNRICAMLHTLHSAMLIQASVMKAVLLEQAAAAAAVAAKLAQLDTGGEGW